MTNLRRLSTGVMLMLGIVFFSCKDKKADSPPGSGAPAGGGGGGGRSNAPISVEAFVVVPQSLSSNIEVPGSLLPYEETEIRSEISGRVVQLNVQEGNNVRRGTLLVKLFDDDLQAQLRKLQVQLEISQKTAERQKELLKINGISQQEYDLSELAVNNLRADIELVKVNIDKTEIRAPFDGRMGLRNISNGAYISPTNIITTISQVNRLKLQFTVPEKYGSVVGRGQTVNFKLDGSDNIYKGTIIALESAIEENTRSLAVRAVVNTVDRLLVPGAFAKVRMTLGRNEKALMIPTQAVIPQGRNKQVILFKGGTAVFEDITTGVRDSANIQVVSGLNDGDTVITTGLLFLRPGSAVTLSKVTK